MTNKLFIILALIAAIVGGYWFSKQPTQTQTPIKTSQSELLQRVPEDSVIFFGGLNTMPFVNPYDKATQQQLLASTEQQSQKFAELMAQNDSPAGKLIAGLHADLMKAFYSDEVTQINDFVFYSLGLYPVIAFKSTDIGGFIERLNHIESSKQINSRVFNIDNAELREYLIATDVPVKMYLAIHNNVVSITAMTDNQPLLELFSAVKTPENSLANSDKLKKLAKTHQLLPFAMGYLDIQSVMRSLTSEDDNLLKQTLNEFDKEQEIAEFVKTGCFQDATEIATRWPRIAFGYRQFDVQSDPIAMDALMIFEHTDNEFLVALKELLGVIPDFSMQHDIMTFAVGLSIDKVASFITQLRSNLLNQNYQCENLQEMQLQIAQNDPAMLAMGTQMVSGLRGVSVHMSEVDMNALTSGDIGKFQGMLVITADQPKNLLLAAGNFYPPLASLDIEADAKTHPLALPMEINSLISMSENAITLQFGDSASVKDRISEIHQGEGLSPSFFRSGMDMSAYFKMIEPMMSEALMQVSAEEAEQMQTMFKLFEKLDMKFVQDISVEDQGIVIKFNASIKNNAH